METNKKKKIVLIVLFSIIAIALFAIVMFLTEDYRMGKDAMWHLHDKYGFSYSEMEVISTTDAGEGWLSSGVSYRGAIVKYKKNDIYVFYYNGVLVDDYVEIEKYEDEVIKDLKRLMQKHVNNYKVIMDPELAEDDMYLDDSVYAGGYIIYVYLNDAVVLEKLISDLNEYVKNNHYTICSMYVVDNKEIYNEIVNTDLSPLLEKKGAKTDPPELLNEVGYDAARITTVNGYNKEIFINKGDSKDKEYMDIKNFDDIIFWYSLETNSFSDTFGDSTTFFVYGINKK